MSGRASLNDIIQNYIPGRETCILPSTSSEDIWCIDNRDILALTVSKDTYQQLGVVGTQLPFKASVPHYTLRFSLLPNAETPANKARRDRAIQKLDELRGRLWDVFFALAEHFSSSTYIQDVTVHKIEPRVRISEDRWIPRMSLSPLHLKATEEHQEDWNRDTASLLEWTALATLGSSRLSTFDKPDPYVSMYDPPEHSQPGEIVVISWKGFMSPNVIRLILEPILALVEVPLLAMTGHSYLYSPVTYISMSKQAGNSIDATPRDTTEPHSEDTWTLLFTKADGGERIWLLADTIGSSDARFG
ncbi:ribonuclease P 40kDa subunit-domain-containing protein [Flagelloscypha sp. PMI_526]|nr:ribonuclease P 40kDa subunit-domain-containing protein [Flagelloscypha sp. PMI_526]